VTVTVTGSTIIINNNNNNESIYNCKVLSWFLIEYIAVEDIVRGGTFKLQATNNLSNWREIQVE
jgi:hypothetical protein